MNEEKELTDVHLEFIQLDGYGEWAASIPFYSCQVRQSFSDTLIVTWSDDPCPGVQLGNCGYLIQRGVYPPEVDVYGMIVAIQQRRMRDKGNLPYLFVFQILPEPKHE
jgi:hypothetical protein